MNIEVNEEKRCIFCQSSTTRVSRGSARALTGSWQQRHASLHSQAPLCTSAVTLTPGHAARHLISGLFRRAVCSAAMCRSCGPPASLLITSRGIHQPSRPSYHTTQSNKPPILAAVYIYSRRASSSVIRRETRLDKQASYDARAACISLTCVAADTSGRSPVLRVFACAAARRMSRET